MSMPICPRRVQFPDSREVYAGDPYVPRVYSPLFAAYGRALLSLTPHPAPVFKSINALMFVMSMGVFLALLKKMSGVEPSLLTAMVFLWLPFSSYTAYFMPETGYLFLFAVLTWIMVLRVPFSPVSGAVFAGVVVGAMLLMKPHAIAMIMAVLLSLTARVIAPPSIRSNVRSVLGFLVIFITSAYVTLVGVNRLLTGTLLWHPVAFVGGLYRPTLAQGVSWSSWVGNPDRFLSVLAGHLIVFCALLAPALVVMAVHLRRLYVEGARSAWHRDARSEMRFALLAFSICAALCAIGMTVNFETQAARISGEDYVRLHGRYYSFVIPLFLIAYFESRADGVEGPARRFWSHLIALGACLTAALLCHVISARVIYPFDYPEAFVFSGWHGRPRTGIVRIAVTALPYVAVGTVVVGYAVMSWCTRLARLVYPILLIVVTSGSHVGARAWQRANSAQLEPLHADARALRQLMPAVARNQVLVVGPEWNGVLAHFLFNFDASPHVLVRPVGSSLTPSDIPSDSGWVILVGDYPLAFPSTEWVKTPRLTCVKLRVDDLVRSTTPSASRQTP